MKYLSISLVICDAKRQKGEKANGFFLVNEYRILLQETIIPNGSL